MTYKQSFYHHPFAQLPSTSRRPTSLRTAPTNGVSGQGSKRASTLSFYKVGAPQNSHFYLLFLPHRSHQLFLFCPQPAPRPRSQAQVFERAVLGNPRRPNHLLPNTFRQHRPAPTGAEETELPCAGQALPNVGIPNNSATRVERHVQSQQPS